MTVLALPFDRVVVGGREYTAEEFMELPLSQRVRHLLKQEVTFFQGQTPVTASLALGKLRAEAASAGKP